MTISAAEHLKFCILGNNLSRADTLIKSGQVKIAGNQELMILFAARMHEQTNLDWSLSQSKAMFKAKPWILAFLAAYLGRRGENKSSALVSEACVKYMRAYIDDLRRTLNARENEGKQIILGPWCGEVGFEVLYWIPFCRYLLNTAELRERAVVVTRGGIGEYYWDGARSVDYFSLASANALKMSEERFSIFGSQKQLGWVREELNLLDSLGYKGKGLPMVHPHHMFLLFSPFFNPITSFFFRPKLITDFLNPLHLKCKNDAGTPPYGFLDLYQRESFNPTTEHLSAVEQKLRSWGELFGTSTWRRARFPGQLDEHDAIRLDDKFPVEYEECPQVGNLKKKIESLLGATTAAMTYGGLVYLANAAKLPVLSFRTTHRSIQPEHEALASYLYPQTSRLHLLIN